MAEIKFSAPNKHHFLVDLAPFGLENNGEVFIAADRPYGLIEATLSRDDSSRRRVWPGRPFRASSDPSQPPGRCRGTAPDRGVSETGHRAPAHSKRTRRCTDEKGRHEHSHYARRRSASQHPVDEVLPPQQLAVYGLQHVMAFYAGAVIVPILLAGAIGLNEEQLIHLINADLFTCGIASILQSVGVWKIGVRLPLLQGVTFTAVSPMIIIGLDNGGGTEGLVYIYGAVIVAGLFTLLIAPFFASWSGSSRRSSPARVITIIGITLIPVAAFDAGGGQFAYFNPDLVPANLKFGSYTNLSLAYVHDPGDPRSSRASPAASWPRSRCSAGLFIGTARRRVRQ